MANGTANPLRDPQDRRLPRIAGPCVLVIFGVTGDLSTKKLMPAVYDLANRGLLPPGFALVGFARRDWEHQDFAKVVHDAVRQNARTPFREEVWQQLSEGIRFVPGEIGDDESLRRLAETIDDLDEARGTGGNHAFYLSIPPGLFQTVVDQLRVARAGRAAAGPVEPGRDREAVRTRPGQRPGAEPDRVQRLSLALGVPHRSLPRQGDRAEHDGAAVRQSAVRAGVEQQLRRPCPDHHGRGHRHRWPRRLLRRHRHRPGRDPEPPAAAAGADRHGGADLVRGEPAPRREAEGARRRATAEADGPAHRAGRSMRAAGPAGRRSRAISRRTGSRKTRKTETYAAIRLDIDNRRWAGVPFYLRTGKRLARRVTEIALGFKRAPHLPFTKTDTEELGYNAMVLRIQPDEGVTLRFGAKVPGTQMEIREVNMDFAYGGSFTESSPEAYERLILDVLLGDPPLFPQHEEVELSWEILDPILDYWAACRTSQSRTSRVAGARPAPTRCSPVTASPGDDRDMINHVAVTRPTPTLQDFCGPAARPGAAPAARPGLVLTLIMVCDESEFAEARDGGHMAAGPGASRPASCWWSADQRAKPVLDAEVRSAKVRPARSW